MAAKQESGIKSDVVFEGYTGKRIFHVSHPDHKKPFRVCAPSEQAAIVAAADKWKETWTEYRFNAFCNVTPG